MPENKLTTAEIRLLIIHELNRVNCAKNYLIRHLPHLIELASFKSLQLAMQEILDDVKKQQWRILGIYELLHAQPSEEGCEVIKTVIEEAYKLGNRDSKILVINDLDIIMYMQIIEHIEMTTCRMLKTLTNYWDDPQVKQLIVECFDENLDNDRLYTLITREFLDKTTA